MSKKKTRKSCKLFAWQQKALEGGVCEKCHRHLHVLSVDHVVPKSLLEMLDDTGELKDEWEENFELVCYPCNRFKAGRLDLANPKTVPLLKELVDKL